MHTVDDKNPDNFKLDPEKEFFIPQHIVFFTDEQKIKLTEEGAISLDTVGFVPVFDFFSAYDKNFPQIKPMVWKAAGPKAQGKRNIDNLM